MRSDDIRNLRCGPRIFPSYTSSMPVVSLNAIRRILRKRVPQFVLRMTLASLLSPLLLCASPSSPMESECCRKMAEQECGRANMTSCCLKSEPQTAARLMSDTTKRASMFTDCASPHSEPLALAQSVILPTVDPIRRFNDSSPPLSVRPGSVQVLRI